MDCDLCKDSCLSPVTECPEECEVFKHFLIIILDLYNKN